MDTYTVPIGPELAKLVGRCIESAKGVDKFLTKKESEPIDIRVFYQHWNNTRCGFTCFGEGEEKEVLAPTVVIKFSPTSRYIYHNGFFAYHLTKRPTLNYYDLVRMRHLPGQDTFKVAYLEDD